MLSRDDQANTVSRGPSENQGERLWDKADPLSS
jgi:hypothetical protein